MAGLQYVGEGRRREIHAATSKTAQDLSAAKQMLMPYRGGKFAAVSADFEFKPGFIYSQVRAISARINQNFDGWPSEELKKSYRSFLGKPCFVNHQNFDPKKARGKVVAARYVEAGDDKCVETVMEIDAHRFPLLAHEIKTGGLDSVSMGVEAGFTICSYCNNRAVDTPDFCEHVRFHKGQTLGRVNQKTGAVEPVLVYEKCYKLGFFELSYVFDPADETAVVSRVIAASNTNPSVRDIESRINRLAYGEVEAPEDIDTLRRDPADQDKYDNETDTNEDFINPTPSPAELQEPNLDQTKRLDYEQEQQGLDADRRSENVEDVGGISMSARNRRRYYAADDPSMDPSLMGGDPSMDPSMQDPSMGGGDPSMDPSAGGPPPGDPSDPMGGDPSGGGGDPAMSDDQLIQEAEADLQAYEDQQDPSALDQSDAGGTDDDYADTDPSLDDGSDPSADPTAAPPSDDGGDLPPWLQDGSDPDEDAGPPPPPGTTARLHGGNRGSSTQNKRRARKGQPMGLAQRSRIASAQSPRRHYADDSGHVDGGPYHEDDNDQGRLEDVYISQTPGSEGVSDPTPGDGTISNTENNLVARKLQQRIQERNAAQQRDMIAWEQITGKRVGTGPLDPADPNKFSPTTKAAPFGGGPEDAGTNAFGEYQNRNARRRYADDGEWPSPGAQSVSGTEVPDEVNPNLSGSDNQGLKGDFDSIALDSSETQPKDASRKYFSAFDDWLRKTTGRTAGQHGNVQFIRRAAARWCRESGISPDHMFPTLGNVLREAKKSETNRRASMRKRADDKLDVAAPQDRIDVEKPVSGTTDADAQASQFDLGDFGGNASDNLADPDLSPDSQIWAPGEGEGSTKSSNRKADGITAVRYAEAYIRAGLAPNTPEEKWKIAGLAQTMRYATIKDRTALLEALNQRAASARRTAGVSRGAGGSVPPGFGQRQMTAGNAANDIASTDSALFIK